MLSRSQVGAVTGRWSPCCSHIRWSASWTHTLQADLHGVQEPPLCSSARSDTRHSVIELLISNGAGESPAALNKALQVAAAMGQLQGVDSLLANQAAIDTECDRTTPLIAAVRHSDVQMVEQLVHCGADCDLTTRGGWTALLEAIAHRRVEMIEPLIRLGCSANFESETCGTPLAVACCDGSEELVRRLLECNASPSCQAVGSVTALATAAGAGRTEVVRLLLERGASKQCREMAEAAAREAKQAQVLALLAESSKSRTQIREEQPPSKLRTNGVGPTDTQDKTSASPTPPESSNSAIATFLDF